MNLTHAQLELSKANIKHNYLYFRNKLSDNTKLMILVKANSYGHGGTEFAKLMEGMKADYLGVASPIEGVELKKDGINLPIIILTTGTESFDEIINYNLEPSIPNLNHLNKLTEILKSKSPKEPRKKYPIHIKVDTGMHRLGFTPNETESLIEALRENQHIEVKSIFTHLVASDNPQHDDFTLEQINTFEKEYEKICNTLNISPLKHALNSAGIERFTQYQFDMVRLGIGIYGISRIKKSNLKPAAALKCPIIQIKNILDKNDTVGYGRYGKINSIPTKVATIPLGYADGIDRRLGRGKGKFEVKGILVPTIGNICMDMCMLDVSNIEDINIGDTVTIFGDNPTISDLANILDTISYEIITSVAKRVKRIVVE